MLHLKVEHMICNVYLFIKKKIPLTHRYIPSYRTEEVRNRNPKLIIPPTTYLLVIPTPNNNNRLRLPKRKRVRKRRRPKVGKGVHRMLVKKSLIPRRMWI